MFHEYALDPEVLRTWPAFRFLTEQCGMSQGRLIAKFPTKWKKAVYAACEGVSPMDRSRIEERLRSIDPKLYASWRDFEPTLEWIRNAARSHVEKPFRAIITTSERSDVPGAVDQDLIAADHECWSPGIPPVLRKAGAMAAAAEMLLKSSSELVFVDQHYSCAARHGRPLAAFLKLALQGANVRRLEYHLGSDGTAKWFKESLENQVRFFGLPPGVALMFYRWKEKPGGEEFHARYILTELGGMRFDVGLDDAIDERTKPTTDVSALDPDTYRQRWNDHKPDSGVFDLVDAWLVLDGKVQGIEIQQPDHP